MFLDKLRLLATVYSRTYAVQGAVRPTFNFPAGTQSVRTYARFVGYDDDGFSIAKTRAMRRKRKQSSSARRYNDNDDDMNFGQQNLPGLGVHKGGGTPIILKDIEDQDGHSGRRGDGGGSDGSYSSGGYSSGGYDAGWSGGDYSSGGGGSDSSSGGGGGSD